MKARKFLSVAGKIMKKRGKQYDSAQGERSGAKVAVAFTAITGKKLTAAEVYLIQQLVKDVRQWATPEYHADSAVDCVSYASLKAEELSIERLERSK